RGALGNEESLPIQRMKPEQSGFVDGRNVGRRRQPGIRRQRIGLDRAGTYLRQGIRRRVNHEIDLATDQILHGRTEAAAIWDEPELRTGGSSEKQPADRRYPTGPGP